MIREVFANIFQIKVQLPHSPLGHLNSYLIKSKGTNLLIDTGLNFPQAFQSLHEGISKAGIRLEELTGILLTHFHVDHVGLIPRFKEASENVKLLMHRVEVELSRLMSNEFEGYMESMETFLEAHGAPHSIAMNLQRFHPAFFTPQAYQELAASALPLEDAQKISVGDYNFQVLWTPGHSPGHICLYEPSLKILVSGDHLLPTITPHIAQFMEDMDPLRDYLNSLERTEKLDVEVVLPAHEETFTNHRKRIEQLKDHHKQRLTEIMDGLKAGSLTAYTLASKVHWNVNYKSWEEFPPFQKYLALGETVAHLNLLKQKGLVRRNTVPISQELNKSLYVYSML
jgi:glyoxylase-like metal-dependent hydrolase (beta-lactamase superfamily II)